MVFALQFGNKTIKISDLIASQIYFLSDFLQNILYVSIKCFPYVKIHFGGIIWSFLLKITSLQIEPINLF